MNTEVFGGHLRTEPQMEMCFRLGLIFFSNFNKLLGHLMSKFVFYTDSMNFNIKQLVSELGN